MKNMLIPTFTETINGFIQLVFVTGRIWRPLYISNQALVLGYILSVAIAIPLGLAAGRVKWIDRILNPYIGVFLAIPIAPLIPIAITALGLGLASRVAIVFLFTFVFIAVNTRAGVRNVDPGLIEMAKSFGASERQIWHRIVIPGAVPAIFAGLRIGLGRAVAGMVIVELLLVADVVRIEYLDSFVWVGVPHACFVEFVKESHIVAGPGRYATNTPEGTFGISSPTRHDPSEL